MSAPNKLNSFFLGICLFFGLSSLGYLLGDAAIKIKEYERTVTVKGLSEREYEADIVIWPIACGVVRAEPYIPDGTVYRMVA